MIISHQRPRRPRLGLAVSLLGTIALLLLFGGGEQSARPMTGASSSARVDWAASAPNPADGLGAPSQSPVSRGAPHTGLVALNADETGGFEESDDLAGDLLGMVVRLPRTSLRAWRLPERRAASQPNLESFLPRGPPLSV